MNKQKIKGILKVVGGVCTWVDATGNNATPPSIPLGANLLLQIDLRETPVGGTTDRLTPYPIDELIADSYSMALDGDYDHLTDPKMLLLSGVTISEGDVLENGSKRTIVTATIPNTNYAGLKAAVEDNEAVQLSGEIAGHDADSASTFVLSFPIIVRNRVWYPDDAPESVASDPEWLNSAQVEAKIAAEVAAAVAAATEELNGEDGTSSFVYIGYASDDAGADFSLSPSADLPFIAFIVSAAELDPPTEGNFSAATWTRFLGLPGENGVTTVTGLNLTPRGNWSSLTTYAENDSVRHANAIWQSLSAGNEDNEPGDESLFWQLILRDGAAGRDGQNPIFGYNETADPESPNWHTTLSADDQYYRISLDGGVTWSIAKTMSQAQAVIVQYNIDATTDWQTATMPSGQNYSTAFGKFFRVSFTGGLYGNAAAISASMEPQTMRLQFSSTGIIENAGDWHAEPLPGDTFIRFFNEAGTIQIKFSIDPGDLDIVSVQLSPIASPWHADFVDGDRFMRVSVNGGSTFSTPVKIVGIDAPATRVEYSQNGIDWSATPSGDDVFIRISTDGATWGDAVRVRGIDGSGLKIDAIGPLASRDAYDSAPIGFTYLATDVLTDGDGRPYNLFYARSSGTQGEWSDGAIMYPGPIGQTGPVSTVPGPRGADASLIADLEFLSGDLAEDITYGGSLVIPGIKAVAQVEIYDSNGDGIAIERGDNVSNGKVLVKTKYADNETIIYFGDLDVTHGGRIRFAQGSEASSILFNGVGLAAATRLRLIRSGATVPTHLLVQASTDAAFASPVTAINTATVASDRKKVMGLSGGEFVVMPETGFTHAFAGKIVVVDMSGLGHAAYIRYRWVYDGAPDEWLYTFYPSTGEAIVSTGADATTGSLQVFLQGVIENTGAWSIDEGATWLASGHVLNDLPPWTFTVTFKDVDGYTTPADASAVIEAGELTVLSAIYEVTAVTADNAYIMVKNEARLVAQNVTAGVGSPISIGGSMTYYIVDGKMFRYIVFSGVSAQVGTSDDWTAVAATETGAVAIRAGKLYAVASSGAVSQIGSLTDWTETNGSFARRGGGFLYAILGTTAYQLGEAVLPLPVDPRGSHRGLVGASGTLFYARGVGLEPTGISGVAAVASTHIETETGSARGFVIKSDGSLHFVYSSGGGWSETSIAHGYDWLYIAPGQGEEEFACCYAVDDNGDLYRIFGSKGVVINTPVDVQKQFIATISLSDLSIFGYALYNAPFGGLWIRNASDLYHVAGTSAPVQILTGKLINYVSGGANPLVITQEAP